MKSNKQTGWPYPGSFIWCQAAAGGTHKIRKLLHEATKHNNGSAACEDCQVRGSCSRLAVELTGKHRGRP